VEAIEEGDEIEILAGELLGSRYLELHPVRQSRLFRLLLGAPDRRLVVIISHKGRVRIRLRQDDRRGSMPAAHVRHLRPSLEFLFDAFQRRNPFGHQMGVVTGTEESLRSRKEARVMLVPAHAFSRSEPFGDLRLVHERRQDDLIRARHVDRAALVGERHRLLVRQREGSRRGIVVHVAAGGVGAQPFPDVTLRGVCALSEVGGGHRPLPCHRFVEA
jgi:hypothetical protein